jgi:hypothetical protein
MLGFLTLAASLCIVAGCFLFSPAIGFVALGAECLWVARRLAA